MNRSSRRLCIPCENVDVQDVEGRRLHVERRILEDEAGIVRRIFDACAAGHGLRTIAKLLMAPDWTTLPPDTPRAVQRLRPLAIADLIGLDVCLAI